MTEAGFYRVDQDGIFHMARWVRGPDYSLDWQDKDTYTYPTPGGWVWFETRNEAIEHFNLSPDTLWLGQEPIEPQQA